MDVELTTELKEKYEKLRGAIHSKNGLVVAYSGGVDSALLAKVAFDELGDSAIAVLIDSETVPAFEASEAERLAKDIGIKFELVLVSQLDDEDFVKNDSKRCYYCRKTMAEELQKLAIRYGIAHIAAGAQATDLDDYRPGIQAFHEASVWHPFIEFEFTKEDIRHLAEFLGLPVATKPAMACLSSRVRYGQEITSKTLNMIAKAEDYLRELGFTQYRARTHDKLLRIEVLPEEFERLLQNRDTIMKHMKSLGYDFVTLDLRGFKSGSMNVELD
jgi:uncharacterized protein